MSTEAGAKKPMQIKVYVVLQRQNLAQPGEPNEKVLGTRLTRASAQLIVDANPGTRIERHLASK